MFLVGPMHIILQQTIPLRWSSQQCMTLSYGNTILPHVRPLARPLGAPKASHYPVSVLPLENDMFNKSVSRTSPGEHGK